MKGKKLNLKIKIDFKEAITLKLIQYIVYPYFIAFLYSLQIM